MIAYFNKKYSIIKNNILTMPNFFYQSKLTYNNLEKLEILKKDGYLNLGKLISEKSVKKAKELITKKEKNNEADFLEKQSIWKISKLDDFEFIFNEIFSENLINLISDYFKRKIYLSDVDIRRVLPVDYEEIVKLGKSNSDWHKDIRGKQIKIMIYLTDVNENDSFFSFIPGTHKKKIYDFDQSRFKDKDIRLNYETRWIGKAGEMMMFDTNIIHRLNRRQGAKIRDTITLYFTPGQALRKIFLDNDKIDKIESFKYKYLFKNSFFEARF